MIFAVCLEMILELQNALTQDCYLYFWRTGIGLVNAICCNCLLFRIGRQSHARIDTPRLTLIFFVFHRIAQTARGNLSRTAQGSRRDGMLSLGHRKDKTGKAVEKIDAILEGHFSSLPPSERAQKERAFISAA